ncbi:UvrD-helicase domain-containing protein [Chloroflexota bacterium]|nr:UvrD-helicase domain-containing protein [Chloroflexota bacterium]
MYTLKITKKYESDLKDLPTHVRDKQLPKTQTLLQQNPHHNSLQSHKFNSFTRKDVFRSYVNDNYRIAWFYGDSRRTIVLWRVGKHKLIDDLADLDDISSCVVISEINPKSDMENKKPTEGESWQRNQPGIFQRVNPNHLRLFGVPEEKIDKVRKVTDFDFIYELNLPKQANDILLSIYTTPNWSPDNYLDIHNILYRESADRLEQYCKGKIKRLMLDLSLEQEEIVNANATGTILIKGVAGSGKTTVGVYRALQLSKAQRLFSTKPVLFLTYTETLTKVVEKLFYELTSTDSHTELSKRIEASTVRDWCQSFLGDHKRRLDFSLAETQLSSSISNIVPKEADFFFLKQENFIKTEIDQVIKGRGVKSWQEYSQISRVGRGRPLQQNARRIIWKIYQDYQSRLKEKQIMDEGDLVLESLAKIKEMGNNFEPYPEVVIDEAQDLTPKELELAAALAGGGESRGLCLLADPSQSIYYKGISWKDANITIYGARVRNLAKNFRNPKPILEAAWALSKADPQHELDEAIEPSCSDRPGFKPRLHYVSSESDQDLKKMKDLILQFAESNHYRLGDIAVLCRSNDRVQIAKNYLQQAQIPVCHFREDHFDVFENDIKTITFHSAKGLEFPVVILMNVEEGVIPRNTSHITNADDLQDAIRMERKLLYVCMTRASEELCMIATEGKGSRFLQDIPTNHLKIIN